MNIAFREQFESSRVRERLFGSDEGYRQFQNALMQQPQAGVVIPGAGGARKVRWSDPRRGKGRRSGVRVIYGYVEQPPYILFLYAYDKNTTDLTPEEKQDARESLKEFRKELGG